MKTSFMVGAGRFLFRYRSLIFPVVFIALLAFFRPHPFLPEPYYSLGIWMGLVIALAGEIFRILTIGLDYIERGGKNHAPYASRLVRGGIYSHVRNPMYVGNLLIALGVCLYSGSLAILLVAYPFFTFVYYAIIAAEENFLRSEFGADYEKFCAEVNRLWPSLRGFGNTITSMVFNWKRPLDKENGTAFYVFLAFVLLPLWRMYHLDQMEQFHRYQPYAWTIAVLLAVPYVYLRILRKRGRFLSYN